MKFTTEHRDRVVIVTSTVEKLDALHAPDLKAELVQLGKSGHLNIVLDLTESRYCDSSGLSAVLVGNRLCRDEKGTFVLCGLQPTVEKLVQISQLDRWILCTWKPQRRSWAARRNPKQRRHELFSELLPACDGGHGVGCRSHFVGAMRHRL